MIRIHGSIQIPTTQVSQIKGLAMGLVRRYPLLGWVYEGDSAGPNTIGIPNTTTMPQE